MIKHLCGIHETADFRTDTTFCLYHNHESESYPPHWHTPFEVIMPVNGGYQVTCGKRNYSLRRHDILIICPCIIHELSAPPSGERIIFQPTLSPCNFKEIDLLISKISPAILITPEHFPKMHASAVTLMLEIEQEYFSALPYYEISIYYRFLHLLTELGRNLRICTERPDTEGTCKKSYLEKFLFITEYINGHFQENLSLEEISALAGFSKYHFTRLFRQYTDTSFYQYLNQQRINHAKTLLLNPDLSVTEAAVRSGFTSMSAFSRMFKQMNACTPTEFRNMYHW